MPTTNPALAPRLTAPRRLGAVVLAAVVASGLAVFAAPTSGAQATSKQQQAEDLTNQIEASDLQISALGQQLGVATAKRDAAQQTVAEAESQIARAEAEVDRILDLVQKNLASLYRRTLRGTTGGELDFSDATDLLKRGQYSEAQNSRDEKLLQKLAAAQEDLAVTRDEAARARDEAAAEGDRISSAKNAIEAARAQQQALLDSIKGELAAAVAAERARRAATVRVSSGGPENFPDVGPPNGSAGQAIAYARAIAASGASYCTGGNGPGCYDCSGLVSQAWGSAGVGLPGRSSGAMYNNLPHIPMESMQPGDLLFWGAGGSSHVALYVGGGRIIDASSSANGVVERGIWGSPVGAARVT